MPIVALSSTLGSNDGRGTLWRGLEASEVDGSITRLAHGGFGASSNLGSSDIVVVSESATGLQPASIAEAYRREGFGCLRQLQGSFAFALYDRERALLFAASDLTSRCPLAYWSNGRTAIVSSSVLRILEHPDVGRALDEPYLAHLIAGLWGAPAGTTALKDVRRIPAGQGLIARKGIVELVQVDRLARRTRANGTRQAWADAFWDELDDAVERAVSAAPSCLALSGGLDSAALASVIGRRAPGSSSMAAFSIVAPASGEDESAAIGALERAYVGGIANQRIDCSEAVELSGADRFDLHDDPLMIPLSFVPARMRMWEVARAAGYRAMIDGEGGDELFSLLIGPRDALVRGRLLHAWRHLRASRARRSTFLWAFALPILPAMAQQAWARRRARSGDRFPSYLTERARSHPAIREAARRFFERHIEEDFVHEVEHWLSNPVTIGVRSTHRHLASAHGMTLISPFLDRRVVELVLGIPAQWILSDRYKGFLADAEVGRVPEDVRTRAKDDRLATLFQRKVLTSRSVRKALDDPRVRDRLGDWVRFDRVHGLLDAIGSGYDPSDVTFWIQIQGVIGFAYWYARASREYGIT